MATKPTTESRNNDDAFMSGVVDIHVHAAPDTRPRSLTELEMVRAAKQAGYRALMFKSNDWTCHDRVFLLREIEPDFECFGSICMSWSHGDKVNVYTTKMALRTSGNYCRCVFMPTTHAAYQYAYEKRANKGIPVLDGSGDVLPEVVKVMELCAEADIMFATGHSSREESIVLAQKAKEVGVAKFVVTHVNSHIWKMTEEQIRKCVDLGAYVEYSCNSLFWGPGTVLSAYERQSGEEFAAFARIAPERTVISTDLGQAGMPMPIDGLRRCMVGLLEAGVPERDVDLMVRKNPAWLLGVDE